MATRSAAKAHRQSLKRRQRHRAVRGAAKTAVKKANTAIAAGDTDLAREEVRQVVSLLDRAAKKGSFHANNVARRKSRLARRLNTVLAAARPAAPQPAASEEKPRRRASARPAEPQPAASEEKPRRRASARPRKAQG